MNVNLLFLRKEEIHRRRKVTCPVLGLRITKVVGTGLRDTAGLAG